MKTVQILDSSDVLLKTDFCRPLTITAKGSTCDSNGLPANFVKWVPAFRVIPEEFFGLELEKLNLLSSSYEFVRGDIPLTHRLDMRVYSTAKPLGTNLPMTKPITTRWIKEAYAGC